MRTKQLFTFLTFVMNCADGKESLVGVSDSVDLVKPKKESIEEKRQQENEILDNVLDNLHEKELRTLLSWLRDGFSENRIIETGRDQYGQRVISPDDYMDLILKDTAVSAGDLKEFDQLLRMEDKRHIKQPVASRRKRSPAKWSSRSRSSSSSSSSSSGGWFRKKTSGSTSDSSSTGWFGKKKETAEPKKPSAPSREPQSPYPKQPGSSAGSYPAGTVGGGGYPAGTVGGGGYPAGTVGGGGYPGGVAGGGGYPGGVVRGGGYPGGVVGGGGGYPGGVVGGGGYPGGVVGGGGKGYPSSGIYGSHTGGVQPSGNSPPVGWSHPSGGYAGVGGGAPVGWNSPSSGVHGKGLGSNPTGGLYPANTFTQGRSFGSPSGGLFGKPAAIPSVSSYPISNTYSKQGTFSSSGIFSGGAAYPRLLGSSRGSHFPVGQAGGSFVYSHGKQSKGDKVKSILTKAAQGYAAYKLHKKSQKLISPSVFGGYGGYHHFGGFGSKAGLGTLGAVGAMHAGHGGLNMGKKILGTIIKIQIAKYALKFGVKAAKLYFAVQLGRQFEDAMIEKFIHRYEKSMVDRYYRNSVRGAPPFKNGTISLGHFCDRNCSGKTKTCLFRFDAHLYQTMSRACRDCVTNPNHCVLPECMPGSGRRKLLSVINKQLPGPEIRVCQGDQVVVELTNNLPISGISLTWHGQTLRKDPYMDGTPGVTQCPLEPRGEFVYVFHADDPGTHFWHSALGLQSVDGIYGPLIVKPDEKNYVHRNEYDLDLREHVIVISEEFPYTADEVYASKYYSVDTSKSYRSLLINGVGPKWTENDFRSPKVPFSRFVFQTGMRHRVRFMSAIVSNCPVSVEIPGYNMTILETDGSPLIPYNTSALFLHPGERWDVVFPALAEGLRWTVFRGHGDCKDLSQLAVMHHRSQPLNATAKGEASEVEDFTLPKDHPFQTNQQPFISNSVEHDCESLEVQCIDEIKAMNEIPSALSLLPNITVYLAFNNRKIHNENFYSLIHYDIESVPEEDQVRTPQINNLTMALPGIPLLQDPNPILGESCSPLGVLRQQCVDVFCECLHIVHIPLYAIVEFILISEEVTDGVSDHESIRFHGYKFWVLGQEKLVFNASLLGSSNQTGVEPGDAANETVRVNGIVDSAYIMALDAESRIKRDFLFPPLKDTVSVPAKGYTVVRFFSDNPGLWLLESSSALKSSAGMSLLVKVGDRFPKAPQDFHRC